jgi:hypothetical protein
MAHTPCNAEPTLAGRVVATVDALGAGSLLLEQPENITTRKTKKINDMDQPKYDLFNACTILFSIFSLPFLIIVPYIRI